MNFVWTVAWRLLREGRQVRAAGRRRGGFGDQLRLDMRRLRPCGAEREQRERQQRAKSDGQVQAQAITGEHLLAFAQHLAGDHGQQLDERKAVLQL